MVRGAARRGSAADRVEPGGAHGGARRSAHGARLHSQYPLSPILDPFSVLPFRTVCLHARRPVIAVLTAAINLSFPRAALAVRQPCPALPCLSLPCPILPCPALPCHALPCPAPAPALPCPALMGVRHMICSRTEPVTRLLVLLPVNQVGGVGQPAACSGALSRSRRKLRNVDRGEVR